MEKDSKLRNIIEKIISQEIDKIASEVKDVVREAVRANLLPQLRATIRNSISQAVEEMLSEPPLTQETNVFEEVSGVSAKEQMPKAEEEPTLEEVKAPVAPSEVSIEEESAQEEIEVRDEGKGRYAYCIADSGVSLSLGKIGIENNEVYTIPYKNLCAVVHNCPTEPYKSDDEEMVKGWLQTHQKVLDVAMEKFGTVLPFGFDTIIKSEDEVDPKQVVKNWLKDDFKNIKEKIDKLRGKQEYGVQIFYDPKVMGEVISRESEKIAKLKEEMTSQKPGMAYMYKQKIEKAVKEEMGKRAEQYFNDFYGAIKTHIEDIKVEKTKRADDKVMFMNLSCLVLKEKVENLGNELEKINNMEGFSVRFTGPWAPYNFV